MYNKYQLPLILKITHYLVTSMLSAGSKVRVHLDGFARRAMVSYIDEIDGTADILLNGCDEEATVPIPSCHPLEPFETSDNAAAADGYSTPPEEPEGTEAAGNRFKTQGTTLFKLKDYEAAAEEYTKAVKCVKCDQLSPGVIALVKPLGRPTRSCPLEVRPALVLCVDEGTADVQYLDDDSEEDGLNGSRLILLSPEYLMLVVGLYLNLARCFLNLDRPEFSVQYCSRARATGIAMQSNNEPKAEEKIVTALFLEAKSHVEAHMPKLAIAACEAALVLDPGNKDVTLLVKQIQRGKDRRAKSNKKIAREVSKWISDTMSQSESYAGALAEI